MKKIFSTILFSAITLVSYAQDSFEFNSKLKPNSTYQTNMKSVMDMNITIETKEEIPGMEKEINSKSESEIVLNTMSFGEDKSNNVPFEIFYTDVKFKSYINGQLNPSTDAGLNGLYEVKIKGIDNGIKREFLSITGPDEFKKMFDILYDSFESMLFTPKGTYKINEQITMTNEMKVPMPDGSEFKFVMDTSYTLTKIENNVAFFDIKMSSKPSSKQMEGFVINVDSYNVTGKMLLDRLDNNISESTMNGPMIISMKGDGFEMIMKTTYDYVIKSKKLK